MPPPPLFKIKTRIVNSENMLIVYLYWEHNDNRQMVGKCKTQQRSVMSKQDLNFTFDVIYFHSTMQNPHGCCDGYKWESGVNNCVGMYSAIIWTHVDNINSLNLKHNIS